MLSSSPLNFVSFRAFAFLRTITCRGGKSLPPVCTAFAAAAGGARPGQPPPRPPPFPASVKCIASTAKPASVSSSAPALASVSDPVPPAGGVSSPRPSRAPPPDDALLPRPTPCESLLAFLPAPRPPVLPLVGSPQSRLPKVKPPISKFIGVRPVDGRIPLVSSVTTTPSPVSTVVAAPGCRCLLADACTALAGRSRDAARR
ncbi:hypothetical protein F441_13932 [Phytophthora nicotianae CJ01A1]|uniref:Uncharacterized protein n=1 Tax=Phytophthora nicotianae CJ01A1 TaxID=1317063 RepID=W2WIN6_PHYNI|nr:hypothetical protein F441_13932 [Phytophthora nicotianae CJ01A1]